MTAQIPVEHHKVIIIGAGFHGIIAAKTYLEICPDADIVLLDQEKTVGGVWAKSRIYHGLNYEIPAPLLNLTDFDMCKELRIKEWTTVNGGQINEFLMRYAAKFDILRRCKLNTSVVTIRRNGQAWEVFHRLVGDKTVAINSMTCDKLIVATGTVSIPKIPDIELSAFNGIKFHSKEMGSRQSELLTEDIKHVTVVGGHKSALEAVGVCAQAGKKVEWLIRDGGGPTWLLPAKDKYGNPAAKMKQKRFMSFLSPSVYNTNRGLTRFLHGGNSWLGTWLLNKVYKGISDMVLADNYIKSENGKRLKPNQDSPYWFSPAVTTLQERDIETMRLIDEEKLVHVNRTYIVSARDHSVTLDTGEELATDAIVLCTGWKLAIPEFFEPSLSLDLGLPIPNSSDLRQQEKSHWDAMDTSAEKHLVTLYPALASPPKTIHIPKATHSPFRLYRCMVPPSLAAKGDNSIAFIGNWANASVQLSGELHSLWAVAYLEGLLPESTKKVLGDEKAMEEDIAINEAFRKKRYLEVFPYRLNVFDAPEVDNNLVQDLGLRPDRKAMKIQGWSWWGWKAWKEEWFGDYNEKDYAGIVDEFMASVSTRTGKKNI